MKNTADQGGCYPQRLKAEVDKTFRDLQNSSYHTQHYKLSRISKQDDTYCTNCLLR